MKGWSGFMKYRNFIYLGLCSALMFSISFSQADSSKSHVFTKLEICEIAGYFDAEGQQFLSSIAFRLSGIIDINSKGSKDTKRHCALLMDSGKDMQREMIKRIINSKTPTDTQIKLSQKANLFKVLIQDAILQRVDFEVTEAKEEK